MKTLNKCVERDVLPRGLGFVHRNNKVNEVSLQSFYMRDTYVDAFSQGINVSQYVDSVFLRRNHLSTNRAVKILDSVPRRTLLHLDLGLNPSIGSHFYEVLAEFLEDPGTYLQRLNLEGNKMGDTNFQPVARALEYNARMKYINFSQNELTDLGLKHICSVLEVNNTINVVFLHWNRFLSKGGQLLANTLRNNTGVQVLDVSFNALGGGLINHSEQAKKQTVQAATAWQNCFIDNKTLIHVDMQHNNLTK